MVWDLDVCGLESYHLSSNTFLKVQTQGSKDFSRLKKPKSKDSKSTLSYDNMAEFPKKEDKKNKKKKFQNQKWEYTKE